MEWHIYPVIVAVGIIAGFINTLAGSGSLLTLPLLMFLGLPASVANGTNRVAIFLQNVIAVTSFKSHKVFEFKEGIWLAVPATIGSFIGAIIAVNFNEQILTVFIGGLLVFMFFIILLNPERWIKAQAGTIDGRPRVWRVVIFFLIGIYGGFIQAGVGFFLLAGLVLGVGADLVKANALKVFIVLCYTAVALTIFFINRQVDLKIGLILAAGNMIGAWIGSKTAVSWGPKFVRIVLLITIFLSAIKLLGIIDLIPGSVASG
ncbi:MAG TPA: sulfite exporter TauE/SafE family protein [Bacteroidales bacterium]|nr:sulfite exporter TauE/SafE family protein [Bacteroidales bacterium]